MIEGSRIVNPLVNDHARALEDTRYGETGVENYTVLDFLFSAFLRERKIGEKK